MCVQRFGCSPTESYRNGLPVMTSQFTRATGPRGIRLCSDGSRPGLGARPLHRLTRPEICFFTNIIGGLGEGGIGWFRAEVRMQCPIPCGTMVPENSAAFIQSRVFHRHSTTSLPCFRSPFHRVGLPPADLTSAVSISETLTP